MKKEDKKQERIENYREDEKRNERSRVQGIFRDYLYSEGKRHGTRDCRAVLYYSIYHLHTSLGEGRFCHRQQKSGSFSWAVLCIDLHS